MMTQIRITITSFISIDEVKKNTLGGSGRVLSEGQGEFSQRVRESSLRESGRVLSEGQGEDSWRVRESSLGKS